MKILKSTKTINPFSGVSFVNNTFNTIGLTRLIDNELGNRVKTFGYQYSDIIRNLTNVFLCGGSCVEDISGNLGEHLKNIPSNNVPSPDTVLRGIKELATENTTYTSESEKTYDFNINHKLNLLNLKVLQMTKQLKPNQYYDFDYDNQILSNNKYDSKKTYKKNKGYFPGVSTIMDKIVYIENRDGNANVKFKQELTLKRSYELLKSQKIYVNRSRMDAGSYSKEIIDVVDNYSKKFYIRANKSDTLYQKVKEIESWQNVEINFKRYEVSSITFTQFYEDRNYRLVIMRERGDNKQLDLFTEDNKKYRTILTNDWDSTEQEIIEYYNQRGKSEKVFDVMNNDFGWKHLPASFLNENCSFMIITALIKNFYTYFIEKISQVFDCIKPTSRLKRFIFRFITVSGKLIYQSRQWKLILYTQKPYEKLLI